MNEYSDILFTVDFYNYYVVKAVIKVNYTKELKQLFRT